MHYLEKKRWVEIDRLFDEALQRPVDERTAFLRARCGADKELYDAVNALLNSDVDAESRLGESATLFAAGLFEQHDDHSDETLAGTRMGPYELGEVIGHGGMGTVYKAYRADGTFEREVALKLIKRGMDTDEVLARFNYERKILGGMVHPNIARLLDAGASDDGRPYFVMELAPGEPITKFANSLRLSVAERLHLFEKVCDAVAFAHRRMVVHRDLKPANILAYDRDGERQVTLLDFGIARLLEQNEEAPITRAERRILTPEYAAPEQLKGEVATTSADVYALGIVLYELLTGKRPSAKNEVASAGVSEVGAPLYVQSIDQVRKAIRGDLDTIIGKALADEPNERYETAQQLKEDLERHRAGLPILARRPSVGYRLAKFSKRNRSALTSLAVILVALVTLAVIFLRLNQSANSERQAAATTAAFLESLFASADPFAQVRQDTLRVRDMLDPSLDRVRTEFADQPETRAQLLGVIGSTYIRLGLYPEAESPLREAVGILRESGDEKDLATDLIELARAVSEIGNPGEAIELSREAIALAEQLNDKILWGRANRQLGLSLTEFGQAAQAKQVLRASYDELAEALAGADHDVLAEIDEALARALLSSGDVVGAESAYVRALDRYDRLYGPNDPRRLIPLRGYSFVLLMAGKVDEAALAGEEAVQLLRDTRPGSGSLANMLAVYGSILRRAGRLDEATNALQESLSLPPRRPADRAAPLGTMASVADDQGIISEAIHYQQRALEVLQASEATSSTVEYSQLKLARFYIKAREFSSAEELLLALEESNISSNGEHAGIPGLRPTLVQLYTEWGRLDEAGRWLQEIDP